MVMELPNKKGTEEEIISNILKWYIKSGFHVIKNEFLGLLNDSLKTGQWSMENLNDKTDT